MSFNSKLKSQLNVWTKKGIITEEQKALIEEETNMETTTSKLFRIFAIIGSLLIGIGIILVISSNWAYLPKILKLFLIVSMPIISIGGGAYLNEVKQEYQKIGDAFIILGTLLIGASIGLLGQVYHLDGSLASLLLWWCILSIPITGFFRYRTLTVISTVLFYFGTFMFMVETIPEWFKDPNDITLTFTIIPIMIIAASEFLKRIKITEAYSSVIMMLEIVSVKVLFIALFAGTVLDGILALAGTSTGSIIFQNFLFLTAIFGVMAYAHQNGLTILRHSTFVWLTAYVIEKYCTWFWSYLGTGTFFLVLGTFLLIIVVAYIKIEKYIKTAIKEGTKQALKNPEITQEQNHG